jgi:hypothetical protein
LNARQEAREDLSATLRTTAQSRQICAQKPSNSNNLLAGQIGGSRSGLARLAAAIAASVIDILCRIAAVSSLPLYVYPETILVM